MIRGVVIIALILSFSEAFGQEMMIIQRAGKLSKTMILPGETLQFSLKGDGRTYKKVIQSFEDSSIVFANYKVHIDDITMIKAPLHPRIVKYSEWLIAGGTILFVADQVNNSIVDDEPFSFDRGVSIVSLSMVGTGILLRYVKKRRFRFPGPHKIRLI